MTFHKPNQGWLIGLGVLIALLWTAQFAADRFKPYSENEFVRHSKLELANTVEPGWTEFSRASRLESEPDTTALTADSATLNLLSRRPQLFTLTFTTVGSNHTTVLPGIRAPPPYLLSA